jgi:hypothetical protein
MHHRQKNNSVWMSQDRRGLSPRRESSSAIAIPNLANVTLACRADATGSTRRPTGCYARPPTVTAWNGGMAHRARTKLSFAFCAACARYPTGADAPRTNHGTFHACSAQAALISTAQWWRAKASPGGTAPCSGRFASAGGGVYSLPCGTGAGYARAAGTRYVSGGTFAPAVGGVKSLLCGTGHA